MGKILASALLYAIAAPTVVAAVVAVLRRSAARLPASPARPVSPPQMHEDFPAEYWAAVDAKSARDNRRKADRS